MTCWLITYQQRSSCGEVLIANAATLKTPAEWLLAMLDRVADYPTILLSALPITDEERQLLQESI